MKNRAHWRTDALTLLRNPQRSTLLILLSAFIVFTAFSVVYVKDVTRRLNIQLQTQQQVKQNAQVLWGKLLLEENTVGSLTRVQAVASKKMGMVIPSSRDIKLIQAS